VGFTVLHGRSSICLGDWPTARSTTQLLQMYICKYLDLIVEIHKGSVEFSTMPVLCPQHKQREQPNQMNRHMLDF
jgi:hypothetical protein